MTREEAYLTGKAEGERYAANDLGNSRSTAYWADYFRADARGWFASDISRARALGVVRGYRQLVRSRLHGRWGT